MSLANERLAPLPPPPEASSSAVRAVMRANRATGTAPERRLRSALHREGLRFRKNCRPVADLRCNADIVFPRKRVAVFVDGCFWHGCPDHGRVPKDQGGYWAAKLARNVARDRRNDAALSAAGWLVVRVWEHEPTLEGVERVREALALRD